MKGLTLQPWVIHLHDGDRAFVRAEIPVLEGSPEITIDLRDLFTQAALQRARALVVSGPDGTVRHLPRSYGTIRAFGAPLNLTGDQ